MDLLRRWRGKRIMVVGDSLSLNQYESLLCLIHASAPNVWTSEVGVRKGPFTGIRFEVWLFIWWGDFILVTLFDSTTHLTWNSEDKVFICYDNDTELITTRRYIYDKCYYSCNPHIVTAYIYIYIYINQTFEPDSMFSGW